MAAVASQRERTPEAAKRAAAALSAAATAKIRDPHSRTPWIDAAARANQLPPLQRLRPRGGKVHAELHSSLPKQFAPATRASPMRHCSGSRDIASMKRTTDDILVRATVGTNKHATPYYLNSISTCRRLLKFCLFAKHVNLLCLSWPLAPIYEPILRHSDQRGCPAACKVPLPLASCPQSAMDRC